MRLFYSTHFASATETSYDMIMASCDLVKNAANSYGFGA